jgi:hypothetical protein
MELQSSHCRNSDSEKPLLSRKRKKSRTISELLPRDVVYARNTGSKFANEGWGDKCVTEKSACARR